MIDFIPFPKIARHRREIVITEKIDGTNACIHVAEDGTLTAGKRSGWITVAEDNFGFAKWVVENTSELVKLGPGAHFGEWWGPGINKRYGNVTTEKRFSLFNVKKWEDDAVRPACCSVVPVMYRGPNVEAAINECLERLRAGGSIAAPGCMKPEGIVIFHTARGGLSKITLEKDDEWKGKSE